MLRNQEKGVSQKGLFLQECAPLFAVALWVPDVQLAPISLGSFCFLGHNTGFCSNPLYQKPLFFWLWNTHRHAQKRQNAQKRAILHRRMQDPVLSVCTQKAPPKHASYMRKLDISKVILTSRTLVGMFFISIFGCLWAYSATTPCTWFSFTKPALRPSQTLWKLFWVSLKTIS